VGRRDDVTRQGGVQAVDLALVDRHVQVPRGWVGWALAVTAERQRPAQCPWQPAMLEESKSTKTGQT
jgi:hypothetical protein